LRANSIRAAVAGVRLDGRPVVYRAERTTRGETLTVPAGRGGAHSLVIALR
jgi:hypothetical protein